jgi:hypothetical protein
MKEQLEVHITAEYEIYIEVIAGSNYGSDAG